MDENSIAKRVANGIGFMGNPNDPWHHLDDARKSVDNAVGSLMGIVNNFQRGHSDHAALTRAKERAEHEVANLAKVVASIHEVSLVTDV